MAMPVHSQNSWVNNLHSSKTTTEVSKKIFICPRLSDSKKKKKFLSFFISVAVSTTYAVFLSTMQLFSLHFQKFIKHTEKIHMEGNSLHIYGKGLLLDIK